MQEEISIPIIVHGFMRNLRHTSYPADPCTFCTNIPICVLVLGFTLDWATLVELLGLDNNNYE